MHEIGRNSNWDMVKSRKMEALENIWIRGQERERERGRSELKKRIDLIIVVVVKEPIIQNRLSATGRIHLDKKPKSK